MAVVAKVNMKNPGGWSRHVGENLLLTVSGSSLAAKEIANVVAYTFGQEAIFGFRPVKSSQEQSNHVLFVRLGHILSNREMQKIANQPGVTDFLTTGKKEYAFIKSDSNQTIDRFKLDIARALQKSITGGIKEIKRIALVPTEDYYTEKPLQSVRRNKRSHAGIRLARRRLHQRIAQAVREGAVSGPVEFQKGYRLSDIIQPIVAVRDLIEGGIDTEADVLKVGAIFRKEVLRPQRRISRQLYEVEKKRRALLRQKESLTKEAGRLEKAIGIGPYLNTEDPIEALRSQEKRISSVSPADWKEYQEHVELIAQVDKSINRTWRVESSLRKQQAEQLSRDVVQISKEIRDFSGDVAETIDITSSPKLVQIFKRVRRYFPKAWIDAAGASRLKLGWTSGADTGGYLEKLSARFTDVAIPMGEEKPEAMILHAYMHHLSRFNPRIFKLEKAFYRRRTGKESLKRLGYRKGVPMGTMVRNDDFGDGPSPGSSSADSRYLGRDYGADISEIMAQAIPGLYGYNRVMTAKLLQDKDLLAFVLGLLVAV